LNVAEVRNVLFHIGDVLGCSGKRHNQVMIAGNIQCRHRDLNSFEGRHQLPIAISVAIIVERPAKSVAREFAGIDISRSASLSRDGSGTRAPDGNMPPLRGTMVDAVGL
jgi:hypothetical protein